MSFLEASVFQGFGFFWNLGTLVNSLLLRTILLSAGLFVLFVLLEDGRFLVVSEHFPADIHDLAEGRVCPDRLDDGIHRVGLLILERLPQTLQRVLHLDIVPRLSDLCDPLDLAPLSLLVNPQSLDRLLLLNLVPVDTYDDPVSLLQLLLVTVGRFGDLALKEGRLDTVQQSPSTFYLVKVLESLLLHLIREPLDVVGSADRLNDVRHARLLGYDLLCPQRDRRCLF